MSDCPCRCQRNCTTSAEVEWINEQHEFLFKHKEFAYGQMWHALDGAVRMIGSLHPTWSPREVLYAAKEAVECNMFQLVQGRL